MCSGLPKSKNRLSAVFILLMWWVVLDKYRDAQAGTHSPATNWLKWTALSEPRHLIR